MKVAKILLELRLIMDLKRHFASEVLVAKERLMNMTVFCLSMSHKKADKTETKENKRQRVEIGLNPIRSTLTI